jgi:hypothetical protein
MRNSTGTIPSISYSIIISRMMCPKQHAFNLIGARRALAFSSYKSIASALRYHPSAARMDGKLSTLGRDSLIKSKVTMLP